MKLANIRKILFYGVAFIVAFFIVFKLLPSNSWFSGLYAASGDIYYVSLTGDDLNPGTQAEPFKTLSYALTQVQPGEIIQIFEGVYTETLVVNTSGTASNHITIENYPGDSVVLDAQGVVDNNMRIFGSYIDINNIKSVNASSTCVRLAGDYIVATNLEVTGCQGHGINVEGQHITVMGADIYDTVMENSARIDGSGWSSALKVSTNANNILLQNNTVYHNYGEGIAVTKGNNVNVIDNFVYDNFSVNIYVDNSYDVVVDGNLSSCTANPDYQRAGNRSAGIALNEESYSGWGAQLSNITVSNNVVFDCNSGISYWGADVPNGGLQNSSIINNTVIGVVGSPLYIAYESFKNENTLIANNIFDNSNQDPWIDNPAGLSLSNNHWVSAMPWVGTNAIGINDQFGDVLFLNTPSYSDRDSFIISDTSPVIDKGTVVSLTADFYNNSRPSNEIFDIGAMEYHAPNLLQTVTVTANPGVNVYAGTDVTLTANVSGGDLPYAVSEWTGACSGTQDTYLITGTVGVYECTYLVQDRNGDVVSDTITININAQSIPTVSIAVSPSASVVEGTSVTLTASVSGGDLPYSGGGWSGDCNGAASEYVLNKSVGTYNCTYTVQDSNGDSASASKEIIFTVIPTNLIPSVSVTASPSNNVLEGTAVTLSASVSGGDLPYQSQQWSGDCTGSGTTFQLPSTLGAYDCMYAVVDANGDIVTDSITVNVRANASGNLVPIVNITSNHGSVVNEGTVVTLNVGVSGGDLPYQSQQWSGNCSGNGNFSLPSSAGNYSCTYTVVDANGDTVVDTYDVTVNHVVVNLVPSVSLSSSPSAAVKFGTKVTLTASVTGGDLPYISQVWSGTCSGNGSSVSLTKNSGTYACTFTVVDANNDTASSSITFIVLPNTSTQQTSTSNPQPHNKVPNVNIIVDPGNVVDTSITVTLGTQITDGDLPYRSVQWSGDCTGSEFSVELPRVAGAYSCKVTVTDANGDSVSDEEVVMVTDKSDTTNGVVQDVSAADQNSENNAINDVNSNGKFFLLSPMTTWVIIGSILLMFVVPISIILYKKYTNKW